MTQMPPPLLAGLTPRWTAMRYHNTQQEYWDSTSRFNILTAGRRSGKTEKFKRKLVKRALAHDKPWAGRFAACAPTYGQARGIYWEDLKALVPNDLMARHPREGDMCIELINGSQIWVIGMDKPMRIEGRPWDGLGLDEYGNMKEQAWGENIRPALSDRLGWCDFIGVPEGRNHYFRLWKQALADRTGEWGAFTWFSSDILPAEEVESARRDLDELTFKQEYEGSFVSFAGMAYHVFNEKDHYRRCRHLYDKRQPLILTFDFNVSPGVANIHQELAHPDITGKRARQEAKAITLCMGEVNIPRNSNTPAVCSRIIKDWGKHEGKVYCYGDATGGASGTAKVSGSDWDIIKRELRRAYGDRLIFRVRKANPRERARVNAVNSRLRSTRGDIRYVIDPEYCPKTVIDFEGTLVLEGGSGELDKKHSPELTHHTDGIGYYIEREYPIRTVTVRSEELLI